MKLILLKLADHANDDGVCWPSLERIQRETQLGRSTVLRKLRWLEDQGWLVRDRDGRSRYDSTVMTLSLPEIGPDGEPIQETPEEADSSPENQGSRSETSAVRGPAAASRGPAPRPQGSRCGTSLYREPSVQPSQNHVPSGDLFQGRKKQTKVEAVMATLAEGCPEALADPEVLEFLRSWLEMRREKRATLGAAWATQVTRKLQRYSVADIRTAAEASASNGWTGIFPKPSQPESREPNTSTDWTDF